MKGIYSNELVSSIAAAPLSKAGKLDGDEEAYGFKSRCALL